MQQIDPEIEKQRIDTLQKYDILDTPPDGSFDRITELAARLLDVPIAIVSIVDIDRIWFKSAVGLDIKEIDKEPGLCASAILGHDFYLIEDAIRDPRSLENSLVTGDSGIRFYAASPLTVHEGYNLGTLCILDKYPRTLTESEQRTLEDLASVVVDQLELRLTARLAEKAKHDEMLKLQQSERLLNEAERLTGSGSWQWNADTGAMYWTDECYRIHEFNKEDFTPGSTEHIEKSLQCYEPAGRKRIEELFRRIIEYGEPYDEQFLFTTGKGNKKWIRTIGHPYFENGKLTRVIGTIIDISARRKQEQLLIEKNQELNTITDVMDRSSLVSVTDCRGTIVKVNQAFCEISGYSREELIGQNHRIINSGYHSRAFWKSFWKTLLNGKPWRGEIKNKAKDGTEYWVDSYISPVFSTENLITHFISIRQNITERKKAESELKKAKENAEKAAKARSEFLANMSHEIRTPLNGVLGFTDLLMQTPLNDLQEQYVNSVNVSARSLLDIINDILDFSKIEAGKLELDQIYVNIHNLLSQAVEIVKYLAIEKELNIELSVPGDMPVYILIDPVRLKQVLINFLSNAVKFTNQGEIELKVVFAEISEHHSKSSGQIIQNGPNEKMGRFVFSVRDTGIGVSPEQRKKLFDAFAQADSSTTRKFGGTGLGLSISAMLVEKMGSKIELESEPGKGSRFSFVLTRPFLNSNIEEDESRPTIDSRTSGNKAGQDQPLEYNGTILVAEDVSLNRILVREMIENGFPGIHVILVKDGQEAVDAFKRNPVDVVLMDVHMPVMDGYNAALKIRELDDPDERVTIIALTAGATEEEKERALNSGMDGFLGKPIDLDKLKKTLLPYLQKKRSRDAE